MAAIRSVAFLVLSALPTAVSARARITPVQQVLTALSEMKAKAEVSMDAEQKVYAEYKEWVSDRTQDLGFEMKTAKSDIEKLTAFADQADNKVSTLGDEIGGLDADIDRLTAEKNDATKVRDTEHAEYVKIQQDYSESVDALERAIQVLSSQAYARPQAEMLLQRMAKTTPGMHRVLAALVQEGSRTHGAPAVAAYEFQSDNIVQVLEHLLVKFKGELQDTEEAESNQAHYYDLEMIHLSDGIAKTNVDRDEKVKIKGQTAAAMAKAKAKLLDTKKDLEADKALRAEIISTFHVKTTAFTENQQVRKDELAALNKAIEIISSPGVADSYAEHVNAQLAQLGSKQPAAFLQMRSSKRRVAANQRAAEFLQKRAGALSSKVLASFAAQLQENPFTKVISMIEELLARLKEQAAAEADHKAWCDAQLKANKHKRNKKEAKVEELTAQIETLTGEIQTMGETIDVLVKEQADLAKAMKEATEQRQKEKATNLDTIADAQAGSAATKQALVILKEFYASQAPVNLSLLQRGSRQVPELASYKGMQGAKKGVIGMLEVIQTDFLRLESDTKAAEAQAARDYDAFMTDAKADALQKHNREVKLRLDKDQAEFERSELKKDLEATADELAKANKYYEYLKPNCLVVHVSWEERVKTRQEEIAALKEAWQILDTKTTA